MSATGVSSADSPDAAVDAFASSATPCMGTSNGGACDGADRCSGTCVDEFSPSNCDDAAPCTTDMCGADGACTNVTIPGCMGDAGTMPGDAGMLGDVGLSLDAGNTDAARDAAAGDASADGVDAGEVAPPSNGCGCAIPGGRMKDRDAVVALLAMLGVIASRRRHRR